jgi:hypothetical protein
MSRYDRTTETIVNQPRSIDGAWRSYIEALPVGGDRFDHRDVRLAFFGGAIGALLAINHVLESANYVERPKLVAKMRELTRELTQFSEELA